jgi:hypothetical protein
MHLLQMDNRLITNSFIFTFNGTSFISISTKIHVIKCSCSWSSMGKSYISPINFLTFFFNEDLKWISIGSTTLIIQWVVKNMTKWKQINNDLLLYYQINFYNNFYNIGSNKNFRKRSLEELNIFNAFCYFP